MSVHDMPAARLTIHLDAAVVWHHRPAYAELVHRAHREGLAGASVFRGIPGLDGDHGRHHLGTAGPCAVVVVDDEPRLRDFLPHVADVLGGTAAVVVLDRVRVHAPRARA